MAVKLEVTQRHKGVKVLLLGASFGDRMVCLTIGWRVKARACPHGIAPGFFCYICEPWRDEPTEGGA